MPRPSGLCYHLLHSHAQNLAIRLSGCYRQAPGSRQTASPPALRESRISETIRIRTQITDSHEGRFDFLTKTLVPYMEAHLPKPSVHEASGLPYFHVL